MSREPQKKLVVLTYRDPSYAGPGIKVGEDEWREEIGPVGSDRQLLELAHGAVENHTAAWLVYFTTGTLGGLWKPPTTVEAVGLEYRPGKGRSRLWQVEGMALIEAAALTERLGDASDVVTTDYRVEGARVMRRNSASADRAKRWCEEYERRQDQSGRHDRPPDMSDYTRRVQDEVRALQVKRIVPDDPSEDDSPLGFYRRAMFNASETVS